MLLLLCSEPNKTHNIFMVIVVADMMVFPFNNIVFKCCFLPSFVERRRAKKGHGKPQFSKKKESINNKQDTHEIRIFVIKDHKGMIYKKVTCVRGCLGVKENRNVPRKLLFIEFFYINVLKNSYP